MEFAPGTVVWAKFFSWPAWPAVVVDRAPVEAHELSKKLVAELPPEHEDNRMIMFFNYAQRVDVIDMSELKEFTEYIWYIFLGGPYQADIELAAREAVEWILENGSEEQVQAVQDSEFRNTCAEAGLTVAFADGDNGNDSDVHGADDDDPDENEVEEEDEAEDSGAQGNEALARANLLERAARNLLRGTGKARKRRKRVESSIVIDGSDEEGGNNARNAVSSSRTKKSNGGTARSPRKRRKAAASNCSKRNNRDDNSQEEERRPHPAVQDSFFGNTRRRRGRKRAERAPPVTSYDYEENIVLEEGDANDANDENDVNNENIQDDDDGEGDAHNANDVNNGNTNGDDDGGGCARCALLAADIAALRERLDRYAGKNAISIEKLIKRAEEAVERSEGGLQNDQ